MPKILRCRVRGVCAVQSFIDWDSGCNIATSSSHNVKVIIPDSLAYKTHNIILCAINGNAVYIIQGRLSKIVKRENYYTKYFGYEINIMVYYSIELDCFPLSI